jgi:hypothetical protein
MSAAVDPAGVHLGRSLVYHPLSKSPAEPRCNKGE